MKHNNWGVGPCRPVQARVAVNSNVSNVSNTSARALLPAWASFLGHCAGEPLPLILAHCAHQFTSDIYWLRWLRVHFVHFTWQSFTRFARFAYQCCLWLLWLILTFSCFNDLCDSLQQCNAPLALSLRMKIRGKGSDADPTRTDFDWSSVTFSKTWKHWGSASLRESRSEMK